MKKILNLVFLTFSICTQNDIAAQDCRVMFWPTTENIIGCDSTLLTFQIYPSGLELSDIQQYVWDFGNGDSIVGSSADSRFWYGAENNHVIHFVKHKPGKFRPSLSIATKSGCAYTYVSFYEFENIVIDGKIVNVPNKNIADSAGWLSLSFDKPLSQDCQYRWNFGDAYSLDNIDSTNRANLMHKYKSTGPKKVLLDVSKAQCFKQYTDTFLVLGPVAKLSIEQNKYQYGGGQRAYFLDKSIFYQNDYLTEDEDSINLINGRKAYVFKNESGVFEAATSSQHLKNRTNDGRVHRLWYFNDDYSEQCTTSTAKNKNVGKNCNFSEDLDATHMYPDWDSIYVTDFYAKNFAFEKISVFNGNCQITMVDTNQLVEHKSWFQQNIRHDFYPELLLLDTVSKRISKDTGHIFSQSIQNGYLQLLSPVAYQLPDELVFNFSLNTGGQSYFAVCQDSNISNNFFDFRNKNICRFFENNGSLPFDVDLVETTDRFSLKYSFSDYKNHSSPLKIPVTVGIIIGMGQLDSMGIPAVLDTFWYHNFFEISFFDFDVYPVGGKNNSNYYCKKDDVFLKLTNQNHSKQIEELTWKFVINESELLQTEKFYYNQPYLGPKMGRNDSAVAYNGENWLCNFVDRTIQTDIDGEVFRDTIVTSIIKDFYYTFQINPQINLTQNIELKQLYNIVKTNDFESYNGIFNCIDTTLSNLISAELKTYENHDPLVFTAGNKRYRYTDETKSKSIEVAEILHFRDSSIAGYDSLFDGNSTMANLWKPDLTFAHREFKNRNWDTVHDRSNSIIYSTFILKDKNQHYRVFQDTIVTGFINSYRIIDNVICSGSEMFVFDSIRYFQNSSITFPDDYPADPRKFWDDGRRYVSNKEIKLVDWGETDTLEFQRNLRMFHTYNEPGIYMITTVAIDSLGCMDTAVMKIEVIGLDSSDFELKDSLVGENCAHFLTLKGKSKIIQTDNFDSLTRPVWEIKYDNHTQFKDTAEILNKVFVMNGEYEILMTPRSLKYGCNVENISKKVKLEGINPQFQPADNRVSIFDSFYMDIHENLEIICYNFGLSNADTSKFFWDDGTFDFVEEHDLITKKYTDTGVYHPYLETKYQLDGRTCRRVYPDSSLPLSERIEATVVITKNLNVDVVENRNMNIYPNPASESYVYVKLSGVNSSKITTIKLLDISGKEIKLNDTVEEAERIKMNISDLKSGIYVLLISAGGEVFRQKITIL
ncbi:MAG: T9SS type A sorting domain-containing protein [Flavobacteriales bacterium]|nr:T9SS type A sorting domain-containing protein [Flavobacteriales bacterium]